ncbi:hypothetical protein G6F70_008657 [Rhizopus microsporus]|nr:hypothetical protein G6F71_005650 [Rhizopus microsporus]KAG1194886.1 hypothetical protein G6F70_008657 [Rhizopus microsporus]KAG1206707.1 hypothetical protein G6F69_008628 [Rhizopus microsporus]KAG1227176.1 hypothetical protein G6F67_008607 [Rhizopus microsporus]KAG1259022.1 hypothetical protein G6F68_008399 [Rhizopus microsporus]
MSTEELYNKALRSFLLKKHITAINNCNKAIATLSSNYQNANAETLRMNIWTLYLNILAILLKDSKFDSLIKLPGFEKVGSLQDACFCIWDKVKEGYGGIHSVDPGLVFTMISMDVNLQQYTCAKVVAEEWFYSLSDAILDHISQQIENDDDHISYAYNKIVELYIIRILSGLYDFETAESFLEYNSILTGAKLESLKLSIKEHKELLETQKKLKEEEEIARIVALENEKKEEKKKKEVEVKKMDFLEKEEVKEESTTVNNSKDNEISSRNTVIAGKTVIGEDCHLLWKNFGRPSKWVPRLLICRNKSLRTPLIHI